MVLLLLIMFVGLLISAVLRRPVMRRPIAEAVVTLAFAFVLVASAWQIAFPQMRPDFDTWAELARYRRHDTAGLIKQHRPLHYIVEYGFMRAAELAYSDLRVWRAGITIVSLFVTLVVLIRMRRTFFRSPRIEYPLLACAAFALSTGGTFLIDSWNDHLPLAPFYIGGLGWVLRLKENPFRARKWILSLFVIESLLHTAEPWLWAVALLACLLPQSKLGTPRLRLIAVTAAIMLLTSMALIVLLPGGAPHAGRYIGQYLQTNAPIQALKIYAFGFALGGIAPLRARYLIPLLAVAFIAATIYRRRFRFGDAALLTALAAALAFPLVYETENPERYWSICVLWPIIALRALRRGLAALRCRVIRSALTALVLPALLAAGIAVSGATALTTLDEENDYNHYGKQLQALGTDEDAMFLAPDHLSGSFHLWVRYYFPGPVGTLENESDLLSAVEELGSVFYNYGDPPDARGLVFSPVLRRPNDNATYTYRVTSAP